MEVQVSFIFNSEMNNTNKKLPNLEREGLWDTMIREN